MRPGTLEIDVAPGVLKWARESIGKTVDEVAKRFDLASHTVEAWEAGQKKLTLKQLKELAVHFKRPLAAFFLPAPPQEAPLPADFRSLPAHFTKLFSEKTLLALRRARRLQELSRDLASGLEQTPTTAIGKASVAQDPRTLAKQTRRTLGLTVATQHNWPDDITALAEWKKAIETVGALVLELPFPMEEGRAFSFADDAFPVIVLNSNDALNGRTFSLFHEYGHLLLGESGICDLNEEGKAIEQFCNAFAGELLVPRQALLVHPLVERHGTDPTWREQDIRQIARRFKVSREVILRRLLIIGRTSQKFYQQKRSKWEVELTEQPKRRGGRRVPARQCVRQNGVPFTTMVLESARQERITYRDISDYLSVGLKHLPAVEAIVREKTARYA